MKLREIEKFPAGQRGTAYHGVRITPGQVSVFGVAHYFLVHLNALWVALFALSGV